MRIYEMTATFGKLSHEKLTFDPGLNVISAPNEWGKSTWCAFLLNMLYGIDTKERTTQTALADKDRYAPWSGAAMSGRIDLCWNGRDITIERSSTGRIPMGNFRAYETETGIDIPELTAANCGQQLLGVERNVFTRAGFLRFSDLPVSQDDALRRRLNNLVSTGDESGAADKLGQSLKDLKNKCRHNKTGLLPEAEAQRDKLRNQLWDIQQLQLQTQQIKTRQQEVEDTLEALENHRVALAYAQARENMQRVAAAREARDAAGEKLEALKTQCEGLPEKAAVQEKLRQLEQLQMQQTALEQETLPALPEKPAAPAPFAGLDADAALQRAAADKAGYDMLCKRVSPVFMILFAVTLLAGIALAALVHLYAGLACLPLCLLWLILHSRNKAAQKRERENILRQYGDLSPDQWIALAKQYQDDEDRYGEQLASRNALAENLQKRKDALLERIADISEGLSLDACVDKWSDAFVRLDTLEQTMRTWEQANAQAEALSAVAKPVDAPTRPDKLTLSQEETQRNLEALKFEQKQLQLKLGQCMGQTESLGQPAAIQAELDSVNRRIARLETYNNAIEMAQDALYKATLSLQRRFSPRITKRAQALFGKLTDNRYQRVSMREDMSLSTAAEDEDTLQELRRRSDGTVDQLYFALRLAVAEELTPNAPLVLDDALVRFDDKRLAGAMEILKEAAQSKQILLFTCQEREAKLL